VNLASSSHDLRHDLTPTVEAGSFLTLHYRLCGPDGDVIVNTFDHRPATLSLGGGELSPAMEQRLVGMREGERRVFDLPSGEAFGPRNPQLVQRVAAKLLRELGDADARWHVGDVVRFPAPDGGPAALSGVVKEVGDDALIFDFNHPLAGQAVSFEAWIIGVL
jgi:FKBP-type peptidyl-prolyl cis-trans isomerase SlpA